MKNFYNQGRLTQLYFYRDSNGLEADLLVPQGRRLLPLEIKSSTTYKAELLKAVKRVSALSPLMLDACLVYAGEALTFSNGVSAIRYDQLESLIP